MQISIWGNQKQIGLIGGTQVGAMPLLPLEIGVDSEIAAHCVYDDVTDRVRASIVQYIDEHRGKWPDFYFLATIGPMVLGFRAEGSTHYLLLLGETLFYLLWRLILVAPPARFVFSQ